MSPRPSLLKLLSVSLILACIGAPAHAAFITVTEPSDAPPTVDTNLILINGGINTGPEFASVSGLLNPSNIAPALNPVQSLGEHFAVLTEPPTDQSGPHISDIILLVVEPVGGSPTAPVQRVTLEFCSDGAPCFADLLARLPSGVPSVEETGALQDITALLLSGPDLDQPRPLVVSVSSDLGGVETAEPGTLAVLGLGIAGLGWTNRRRRR
jgi:hypothetical protein